MTDIASSPTPATSLPELSGRMADDLAHLDAELAEVDLLVVQAKTEAARHESRRVAASEKLATAISTATSSGALLDPTVSADLNAQLVLLTKRAALMELRLTKPLHHEPWDEGATWRLPEGGPMTSANMALPSIIFVRDRARYDAEFPGLSVDSAQFNTVARYLLSGGVAMRSLAPGWLFAPVAALERLFSPAARRLASMMTVELVRR